MKWLSNATAAPSTIVNSALSWLVALLGHWLLPLSMQLHPRIPRILPFLHRRDDDLVQPSLDLSCFPFTG